MARIQWQWQKVSGPTLNQQDHTLINLSIPQHIGALIEKDLQANADRINAIERQIVQAYSDMRNIPGDVRSFETRSAFSAAQRKISQLRTESMLLRRNLYSSRTFVTDLRLVNPPVTLKVMVRK